ncbi:MAG: pyrimidine 5'-nucleotidase [Alphaproteobacteria bacterium]|nr:pyrimidine 5'-nucleotidase [Alphaproteobacteria bacterium]
MTPPRPDLRHVDAWVFDLDNTLYPATCNLFREIDSRMAAFIREELGLGPDEARRLQKDYYVRYGTTMAGLMREHDVCPERFMAFVHDIDLTPVAPAPELCAAIEALPGRKFVFTNGSAKHAANVLGRLGLSHCFDEVFDIKEAGWTPKPHRVTYERFLAAHAVAPSRAAMFEDIAHNLKEAFELGMTTVLVASQADWIADEPDEKRPARPGEAYDYVHHITDDLAGFLRGCETAAGFAQHAKEQA